MESNRVRKSRRNRATANFSECSSYPEDSPLGPLEVLVAKLDQESFRSHIFAEIDDILTFTLFAAKKKQDRRLALKPACAFEGDELSINADKALSFAHVWEALLRQRLETKPFVAEFTAQIKALCPEIMSTSEAEKCFQHLAARYHVLLHDPSRCVTLEKVEFEHGRISAGLKSTRDIEAGMILLPLCSSMSSDCVKDRKAISVIQAGPKNRGPQGPRLILGPFRFANSDCNPNCQFMAIPQSHAFTLVTLVEVKKGQSITVKYSDDDSYFGHGECRCGTCSGEAPQAKRQKIQNPVTNGRKLTRRGGAREKRRKLLESFRGHSSKGAGDMENVGQPT
ncbi:hypothetical protein CPB83DRAFT_805179 [Crepidotus variabilis]|uniref:SET domain-containing protein n=1 Tax=Crepidotus variabilis TaxID=179855 RepID=A0A9P6JUC5_9AGAR|nr:hypothetical protein CPB83DRAFT_805179 [Crepidotus variabilis]